MSERERNEEVYTCMRETPSGVSPFHTLVGEIEERGEFPAIRHGLVLLPQLAEERVGTGLHGVHPQTGGVLQQLADQLYGL